VSIPWQVPPPPDRGYLVAASNARAADDPLPAEPPIAAPPAPGRFVTLDDRGLYIREIPAADGGPPDPALPVTVYVHGLAGSSTNFDSMSTLLAAHTRGFSVDLPGFGRSDPPPREHYSLVDDADLIARLVRRLSPGRPVHLVGNSLGGMVCTALASRHPELVLTLSLISPAVPDLRLTQDRGADPRLALLLAPGTLPAAVRRLAAIGPMTRTQGMAVLCYGDPSVLTESDLRTAADDIGWRYVLPWVHNSTVQSLRALMRSYLRPGPWSFHAAAARITAPTLVIWGARDRLVDAKLAPATAAAFADGRLLILPTSGHVSMMEQPTATARAVLALWQDAADPTVDQGDPARDDPIGQGAPSGRDGSAVAPSTS
jgi:pimeloyl-ACP methyl ester carboxylesterase